MAAPCKTCDNKGCGSYHDKCLVYLNWKEEKQKADQKNSDPEYKKRRPWR